MVEGFFEGRGDFLICFINLFNASQKTPLKKGVLIIPFQWKEITKHEKEFFLTTKS